MVQVRRGAILMPLLIALAIPAAVTAAPPRHAASTVGDHRAVTEFPMADGAVPFGVTAGPRGEYVSLNSSIGRFDHRGNLTTIPIPSDASGCGLADDRPVGRHLDLRARQREHRPALAERLACRVPAAVLHGRNPAGERSDARRNPVRDRPGEQYDRPARSSDGSDDLVPGPDARRDAPRSDARFRWCVVVHRTERRPDRPHDP